MGCGSSKQKKKKYGKSAAEFNMTNLEQASENQQVKEQRQIEEDFKDTGIRHRVNIQTSHHDNQAGDSHSNELDKYKDNKPQTTGQNKMVFQPKAGIDVDNVYNKEHESHSASGGGGGGASHATGRYGNKLAFLESEHDTLEDGATGNEFKHASLRGSGVGPVGDGSRAGANGVAVSSGQKKENLDDEFDF
mmetsp:Transcript_24421/g.27746  ORF Transcript_24421/g.27746 Transcript_24421/m.27746 type:complete len:191 (-) Transcript_24421:1810-2382(-)